MSNQHVLKIHPAPLADLLSGAKTAEVRRNDRGFQVGDTVRLMEVNPETGNWTGAADHVRTISHIQTGYGLPDGICVLSYADTAQREALARVQAERDGLRVAVQHETATRRHTSSTLGAVLAELQSSQAQLAEAVILIGQVQDCRSFDDVKVISRWLAEFLARHAQAEQQDAQSPMAKIAEGLRHKAADEWANHPSNPANQEAQGAQAVDERAAFEHWASDGGLYPNAVERRGDQYKLAQTHSYWQAWQARASLCIKNGESKS